MTVIAARRYRDGVPVGEVDLDTAEDCHCDLAANEFIWVGLHEPTDEVLEKIGHCFGLHPLAMEDAQQKNQLPKVEQYGDQLFLLLRTASVQGEQIVYGQTAIFLGASFIITVRQGSARAHSTLRKHLESTPKSLAHGPDFVLHSILDFIVDGYFPIVEAAEERALAMETAAADSFLDRPATLRIFSMRREAVRFQRILGVMDDVAARLVNVTQPHIDANMLPYFRDVLDHIRRVEYRLGGLREILTSVVETSNLLEQQRQGAITRQLAAWAAILAVPTAMAGIYGMNFDNMPELHWKHGYFAVLFVMFGVCSGLYLRFRRSGWI